MQEIQPLLLDFGGHFIIMLDLEYTYDMYRHHNMEHKKSKIQIKENRARYFCTVWCEWFKISIFV